MHKRKVRKEHAVPPTTSTYNEILRTVRDSWIGATAISPSSRSHNLGYSVDRSRLLNRSNSHQPIVTVNNLGYSVDRSRLLNRSNSHQPIVTVNNIGSSVHHQSGFQSNDWHQLAPKDLFMVVTNDHTTYDSQKQAAKVVNINKDIHYTHTKQFICTFGKGENPSLDTTNVLATITLKVLNFYLNAMSVFHPQLATILRARHTETEWVSEWVVS